MEETDSDGIAFNMQKLPARFFGASSQTHGSQHPDE